MTDTSPALGLPAATGTAMLDLHSTAPGSASRRRPRAHLHTDAPSLSLNGDWRFRWSPVASVDEDFAADGFDDADWQSLPVPAHWVLHGHGAPIYTNVQYPFPVSYTHLTLPTKRIV